MSTQLIQHRIIKSSNVVTRKEISKFLRTKGLKDRDEITPIGVPQFNDFIDQNLPKRYRIVWFFITLLCFILCCYQISDRIITLLSYPSAVDIQINEITSFIFPGIKLCSMENDYVLANIKPENEYECIVPIYSEDFKNKKIDYDKFWLTDGSYKTYQNHEFSHTISTSEEISFCGRCTIFGENSKLSGREVKDDLKINIYKGKFCTPSYTVVVIKNKVDFSIMFGTSTGSFYYIKTGLTKYKYLNVRPRPCSSEIEFSKCYKQCIIRRIREETSCRLPYFHPSINLPKCDNFTNVLKSFQISLEVYLKPELTKKCGCALTCDSKQFLVYPNIFSRNITGIGLIFQLENYETVMTEFLAYDITNLFVDIGGNLGLFLGLSIPAITYIFFAGILALENKFVKRKSKQLSTWSIVLKKRVDPLLLKLRCNKSHDSFQKNYKHFQKLLNFLITTMCFCLSIFMIVERSKYFMQCPVRRIVEIETQDNIIFPSYTVCGSNKVISNFKKKYVKKLDNASFDKCQIDMIDLMDDKLKIPLTKLWDKSEVPFLGGFHNVIKKFVGVSIIHPNKSTIFTHLGKCSNFKFKKEAYSGFLTNFPLIYSYSQVDECPNSYFNVFYDDLGSDSYNILTQIDTARNAYSFFNYRLTTIKRLNRRNYLCYNKEKFKKCKEDCFKKHLKEEILCKLPFISNELNLTECTSSKNARTSRAQFVKILTLVTLGSFCSCVHPCKENVINIGHFSQIKNEPNYIVLLFNMFSNVVENVIEVEEYTIIALFCDVGNSLGLALGMSLLTVSKHFYQLFSFIMKKLFLVKLKKDNIVSAIYQ